MHGHERQAINSRHCRYIPEPLWVPISHRRWGLVKEEGRSAQLTAGKSNDDALCGQASCAFRSQFVRTYPSVDFPTENHPKAQGTGNAVTCVLWMLLTPFYQGKREGCATEPFRQRRNGNIAYSRPRGRWGRRYDFQG